jgi:hypothetical protein
VDNAAAGEGAAEPKSNKSATGGAIGVAATAGAGAATGARNVCLGGGASAPGAAAAAMGGLAKGMAVAT